MTQSHSQSDVRVHGHENSHDLPSDTGTNLGLSTRHDQPSSPPNQIQNNTPPGTSSVSPSSHPQVILGSPINAPADGQPSCVSPLHTRSRPALSQSSPARNHNVYVKTKPLYFCFQ